MTEPSSLWARWEIKCWCDDTNRILLLLLLASCRSRVRHICHIMGDDFDSHNVYEFEYTPVHSRIKRERLLCRRRSEELGGSRRISKQLSDVARCLFLFCSIILPIQRSYCFEAPCRGVNASALTIHDGTCILSTKDKYVLSSCHVGFTSFDRITLSSGRYINILLPRD